MNNMHFSNPWIEARVKQCRDCNWTVALNLQELDPSSQDIELIQTYSGVVNLQELYLGRSSHYPATYWQGNCMLSDDCIIRLIRKCSSLKSLVMDNRTEFSASVWRAISKLEQLECLVLQSCGIADAGIAAELCATLASRHQQTSDANVSRIDLRGNPLCWREGAEIDESFLGETNPKILLKALIELRDNGVQAHFGRVVFVGPGSNGKSTVRRFAIDDPEKHNCIDPGDKGRTIGFDSRCIIEKASTLKKDKGAYGKNTHPLRLNFIDTGGQLAQLQSHCNLIYRNTYRTLFCLVLRRDQSFDDNRADWYLRMLQSFHRDSQAKRIGKLKLPVLLTTTRGEATVLKLPTQDWIDQHYQSLNVHFVDPNIRIESGILREEIEMQTQEVVLEVMRKQALTSTILPDQVNVEHALRKEFELGESQVFDRPLVCAMTREKFKKWLNDHGVEDSNHGIYAQYLHDTMTAIIPNIEDADIELSGDESKLHRRANRFEEIVTMIFNPRFILNFVYKISMDNQIKASKGFMHKERFDELTEGLTKHETEELIKVLKRHQMVFEWYKANETDLQVEGYLVPDQLPERMKECRAIWTDVSYFKGFTRCKQWLSEYRLFRLIASEEFGKSKLMPLDLHANEITIASQAGEDKPMGVWRNEVCLKDGQCQALIQTNVFQGELMIHVKGGTNEQAHAYGDRIFSKLTVGIDPSEYDEVRNNVEFTLNKSGQFSPLPANADLVNIKSNLVDGMMDPSQFAIALKLSLSLILDKSDFKMFEDHMLDGPTRSIALRAAIEVIARPLHPREIETLYYYGSRSKKALKRRADLGKDKDAATGHLFVSFRKFSELFLDRNREDATQIAYEIFRKVISKNNDDDLCLQKYVFICRECGLIHEIIDTSLPKDDMTIRPQTCEACHVKLRSQRTVFPEEFLRCTKCKHKTNREPYRFVKSGHEMLKNPNASDLERTCFCGQALI